MTAVIKSRSILSYSFYHVCRNSHPLVFSHGFVRIAWNISCAIITLSNFCHPTAKLFQIFGLATLSSIFGIRDFWYYFIAHITETDWTKLSLVRFSFFGMRHMFVSISHCAMIPLKRKSLIKRVKSSFTIGLWWAFILLQFVIFLIGFLTSPDTN